MKLIIVALLTVFAFSAQADNEEIIKDIFGNIIGGIVNGNNGGNGHGHGGGGHGHGGGGWGNGGHGNGGGWGNGGYGPGGNVMCTAGDAGWEEHGSHASCRECFRKHGRCIETCKEVTVECRVDGIDRRGRVVSFYGNAPDYRWAQEDADRQCWRARARDCRPNGCQQLQNVVSRRDCRR